jgi:tetratricopeptide (TPR) repeat protein
MKKLCLFAVMFTFFITAYSQNNKVVNAYNYLKSGQLDKAKENIDAAVVHPQTSSQPKTWLYKGNVYLAIALTDDEKFKNLHPEPLTESYNAYQKSIEIDKDYVQPNASPASAMLGLFIIGEQHYNKGVELFNNRNFEQAIIEFEQTKRINAIFGEKDSLATFNAAICAIQIDDYDKAIQYLRELVSMNYMNPLVYSYLASMYIEETKSPKIKVICNPDGFNITYSVDGKISQNKVITGSWSKYFDAQKVKSISVSAQAGNEKSNIKLQVIYTGQILEEVVSTGDFVIVTISDLIDIEFVKDEKFINDNYKKALQVIKGGITKFPNDLNLIIAETNVYLATGEIEKAQKTLELAIEKDPENPLLYFTVGSNYDQMSRKEELPDAERTELMLRAERAYLKAIDISKDYFDAYYNLGALFFNEGVRVFELADAITDLKVYAQEKEKFDALWNKSIPYLEKAHELQPNDIHTLISLRVLYARLSMNEKLLDVNNKIKALQKD